MVRGIGPSDTNIMVVADYPTQECIKSGYALESPAGRKVEKLLKDQDTSLRTSLTECYRTCFYKTSLEGAEVRNLVKRKKVIQEAMASVEYRELLRSEIENITPNIIIALGELALQITTGCKGIHKYRGSILPISPLFKLHPKIKVVPTLHPRSLFKQPEAEVYVRCDIEKALKRRTDPHPFEEDYNIWICRKLDDLRAFYARHQDKGIKFCVTDLETFLGYITYIGLCFDSKEAISIPLWDKTITNLERAMILKEVQYILNHESIVNQNMKFDKWYYNRFGIRVPNVVGDTMLAMHTLLPEFPKNLGFQTSIYTDLPYHKDEGSDFNPSINPDQLALYNAKDCIVTWRIHEEQEKDLKEQKLWSFYKSFVMPLFDVYYRMDQRGIRIDDEQRKKLEDKYRFLWFQYQELLNSIAGREINVKSSPQVGQFIYEDLKCEKHIHKTPNDVEVYSTDKDTIEEIYINELGGDEVRVKILKALLITRKLRSLTEFLEKLKVHPDGRLRATSRLEGTESGRTSASKSYDPYLYLETKRNRKKEEIEIIKFDNYGYPFQTITKHGFEIDGEIFGDDVWSIFVPSEGFEFVEGDLGQAEARVVSVLANDFDTLDQMDRTDFKRNEHGLKDDLHTITAMWTTGLPFESITDYHRQNYGKRPRHAGNYDQTAYGLAEIIHRPINECSKILDKFHNNAPQIRAIFHRLIRDLVCEVGYLQNPFGRRRDFFKRRNDKLYRIAYSYIPQNTVSDHMKWTAKLLDDEFDDSEVGLLCEKHDSLLFEVRKEIKESFKEKFREIAEKPISFRQGSIVRDFDLVIPLEV